MKRKLETGTVFAGNVNNAVMEMAGIQIKINKGNTAGRFLAQGKDWNKFIGCI